MRTIKCPLCNGLECARCSGTGRRLASVRSVVTSRWNTCFACKGTGKRSSCTNCDSTGVIRVQGDSPCPSCLGTGSSAFGLPTESDKQSSCRICRHFLGAGPLTP